MQPHLLRHDILELGVLADEELHQDALDGCEPHVVARHDDLDPDLAVAADVAP
jgi:hypothetical protein